MSGSSETDLARLLASPPSPKQPNTGVTFSDSVVFMFLLSITTCAGYAIGILLFIGLERNQPSLVTGEHNQLFILIGGLLLAGISSLVIFLPPIIISHRMINSRIAREKAKYDIEKPAWNRAMEKYQGLYFCHRDGIVFDPETRETCQPTSLREFLYKSTVSAPLPTKPPPSKPLSATPPKGIRQTPYNAGSDIGRLEPTQKPWYRSTVFLVLMFFLFQPAWAILILTDKNQGSITKLIAGVILVTSGFVYYSLLDPFLSSYPNPLPATAVFDSSPGPISSPESTPDSSNTSEPTNLTLTQTIPTLSTATRCVIIWVEHQSSSLTGKTRSMVWEEIVRAQVIGSGMTASQFYNLVVENNPTLKTDGYVFQKDKTYLLPKCQ